MVAVISDGRAAVAYVYHLIDVYACYQPRPIEIIVLFMIYRLGVYRMGLRQVDDVSSLYVNVDRYLSILTWLDAFNGQHMLACIQADVFGLGVYQLEHTM